MCGIFGFTGRNSNPQTLMDGIRRLEYRGYDSWGVAINGSDQLEIHKATGRIAETLPETFQGASFRSGIAHTRWATHGAPTLDNAHPHTNQAGDLALVHNGIIENYKSLRSKLTKLGFAFRSETDSEVAIHLIQYFLDQGLSLKEAFLQTLNSIEGTYGLALISNHQPDRLLLGRLGSPMVIGQGEGFHVFASDPAAIIPFTRRVVYLEDGECAEVGPDQMNCFRLDHSIPVKQSQQLTFDLKAVELNGFEFFMEKEIYEQPQTITDCMRGRLCQGEGTVRLGGVDPSLLVQAKRIKILACGTSLHAGLIGKYMFEMLAGIPTEVNYAAEFRYATPVIEPDTLVIAISQSGETADTLAGVREAQRRGAQAIGIVNAVGSSIARECGQGVFLHVGPEIGVASTKAFTSQVVVLCMLAIQASRLRGRMTLRDGLIYLDALRNLPELARQTLELGPAIALIAEQYKDADHFLYIGRLFEYPLALEGALKLKEISYIHAEGISAAELKHGPIALIDKDLPVVVLATQDKVLDKMISNVHEIKARGGRIISVVREGCDALDHLSEEVISIPPVLDVLTPILGAIPLQLLAYHIAAMRGCDVDRPRNLAKSVTVE
ncbi:MAG: glutamine--fructose-6-phosphate transaminase (isomerizing) [Verrucomicrobiota bacterium]|jgi:glucosamine--fructose-6-phosphate aminotransferase (isomerizing)